MSYRPTERVSVRVRSATQEFFIKVVPPAEADALVQRHTAVIAAGIPAARVKSAVVELGVIVLESLGGPTMKEEIKQGRGWWPEATEFDRLAHRFSTVDLPASMRAPSRVEHGLLHAEMLKQIMPAERARLIGLGAALSAPPEAPSGDVIHGDLHEAQLITERGKITGVLDLDDVGHGSATDDRATLLAFLRFRALNLPSHGGRLLAYAEALRRDSTRSHSLDALDAATASVMIALATGPFRVGHPDWEVLTRRTLVDAEAQLMRRPRGRVLRSIATSIPATDWSVAERSAPVPEPATTRRSTRGHTRRRAPSLPLPQPQPQETQ